MSDILYLNEQRLAGLGIGAGEVVAAIEDTLLRAADSSVPDRSLPSQSVLAAPKTGITAADGRYMMATLATDDDAGVVAVKALVANPHPSDRQLPGTNGTVILLDSKTGQLRAVLDAGWITAVRTAGLSAVAAKRLASPHSQSIGLVGAGVQAESHLRLFAALFPLREVRVVGRSASGVKRIVKVAKELGLSCESVAAEPCLLHSEIVVSSVSRDFTIEPFLDAGLLQAGAFATIADLTIPWVKATLTRFGRIYIDDISQEQTMGQPILPMEMVAGDLTNLMQAETAYDASASAAFVFRGVAAGDLALAALVYRRVLG